jgi:hypothetical protein
VNLASVMDAISARLDTIAGLRCFAYPPGSVVPPAAVVGYPTTYGYDETYGRGVDRMSLPVVLVIGKVSDRVARDQLAAYVSGSGTVTVSVKTVIEGGTYTAFDVVRVTGVELDTYTIGATDYLAAIFDLDILGKGA